jgi:uncharacterized protein (DUF1499 family)
MNTALGVLAAIIALTAAGVALVRLSPSAPARWHVDPMTAQRTGKPNDVLLAPEGAAARIDGAAPVWATSPEALMDAVDAAALGAPRTRLLARGPDPLLATYLQRTALMGFPDFISIRAMPAGEGRATLAVFSRSRYGRSDLGVNKARASAWLAAIPLPKAD